MTLSSTLDIARSSLSVTSERTSIISRNIAHAGSPWAARKIAGVAYHVGGGSHVLGISRLTVEALRSGVVNATSESARRDVVSVALERLNASAGDAHGSHSPANQIGQLAAALQTFSSNPADMNGGRAVLAAAHDVVGALNSSARLVEEVRAQADADIRSAVDDLNAHLKRLEDLNARIVVGTRSGADVSDDLDARDALVASIAEVVGVTVIDRPDNAIALYTDSGLTLMDSRARQVALGPGAMVTGEPGPAIYIDGVTATGSGSVMAITTGRLAGLVEVRDGVALTYGAQLDEIARGLIMAFAESDQGTPATLPDLPGLFTVTGGMPTAVTWSRGLALKISVNANADPARGGDLSRLRDGAMSDPGNPAYVYNTAGTSGFAGRIEQLLDGLSRPDDFDPVAQLSTPASSLELSSSSLAWLQGQRKANDQDARYAKVLLQRTSDALADAEGINIDDEMTELLELERTYQASAKLIATVDSMFNDLLQAVR